MYFKVILIFVLIYNASLQELFDPFHDNTMVIASPSGQRVETYRQTWSHNTNPYFGSYDDSPNYAQTSFSLSDLSNHNHMFSNQDRNAFHSSSSGFGDVEDSFAPIQVTNSNPFYSNQEDNTFTRFSNGFHYNQNSFPSRQGVNSNPFSSNEDGNFVNPYSNGLGYSKHFVSTRNFADSNPFFNTHKTDSYDNNRNFVANPVDYPSLNTQFNHHRNPSSQRPYVPQASQAPQIPSVSSYPVPVGSPRNDSLDYLKRVCGIVGASVSLLVNGEAANKSDYPWAAALFKRDTSFWCGATLITQKHALTAAHCVDGVRASRFYLVLGREDISERSNVGKQVAIFDIRMHGDYKAGESSDSDIAILVLDQDVDFSAMIRPICLPDVTDLDEIVGTEGVIVGWGKDENGTFPSKPRKAVLPIVSESECLRSHTIFNTITSNRTYCAGNRNGTGPCSGDSGNGMFIRKDGRWSIRGIVSKAVSPDDSSRACDLNYYTVFVDVAKYVGWILKHIQQ